MESDLREKIADLNRRVDEIGAAFDVDAKVRRIEEIDKQIADSAFWEGAEEDHGVLKERTVLLDLVEQWRRIEEELEDGAILLQLAEEEEDEREIEGVRRKLDQVEKQTRNIELREMLGGQHDLNNAIVSINAGAGGTEAQDWAEMLLRMYLKWAEKREYKSEIIDILTGEEAGIKNVTFTVSGNYAYGYVKAEIGIHRLVRISPFDTGRRRHTSFASVYVYPEIPGEMVVEIDEPDLRIDTFRSSGAGGQHVNKTDSAVRITHIPTGIVVQCQNERSQHKNKATAMKVLRSKLYEKELQEKAEKEKELYASKKEIAWGSQIRSYIMHPYKMVKDHRTGVTVGDVEGVLDGELDRFMESYLWGYLGGERGRAKKRLDFS
ncbi:MAG: peptide chain release factor 2 [Thermodesulfobacteriota bacterium]